MKQRSGRVGNEAGRPGADTDVDDAEGDQLEALSRFRADETARPSAGPGDYSGMRGNRARLRTARHQHVPLKQFHRAAGEARVFGSRDWSRHVRRVRAPRSVRQYRATDRIRLDQAQESGILLKPRPRVLL
jgi:hypothetical protein